MEKQGAEGPLGCGGKYGGGGSLIWKASKLLDAMKGHWINRLNEALLGVKCQSFVIIIENLGLSPILQSEQQLNCVDMSNTVMSNLSCDCHCSGCVLVPSVSQGLVHHLVSCLHSYCNLIISTQFVCLEETSPQTSPVWPVIFRSHDQKNELYVISQKLYIFKKSIRIFWYI